MTTVDVWSLSIDQNVVVFTVFASDKILRIFGKTLHTTG